MKVLHILGYLAERYGGPPRVAINLGQALQKLGVGVSWWATATEADKIGLAELDPGAYLFPTKFPHSWCRSPDFRHTLARHIDEADVLHLHQVWDYPLYAASQLARKHNKPYIVTPHGIFSQPWRYNSLKKQLYLRLIAHPFLNNAACIHAITPTELSGFGKVGLQVPYVVIPNGIDRREFAELPTPSIAEQQWPELQNRIVVFFLGRLSPEKGLDLLIHAWKNIKVQYSKAILMIAGPDHNGYRSEVESFVAKWGVKDSVLFTGMLKGRHKMQALSRADIFIQPSYSEGFSMSILEALAAGKPCVITENCNFPEVAEIDAGKVISSTVEDISDALLSLLAIDRYTRQQMGLRGKHLVINHYTWDIAAQKMLTVYENVIEGEPIPTYFE